MFELPETGPFYALVWEIVRQIPSGQVATYGQIAAMIAPPAGVDADDYARLGPRWVGEAMNAVSRSDDPSIPWHRVINSRGGISLPEDSRAAALQRARLRHEGVAFDGRERVDLAQVGGEGPPAAWCAAHGLAQPPSLRPAGADGPQQLSLF